MALQFDQLDLAEISHLPSFGLQQRLNQVAKLASEGGFDNITPKQLDLLDEYVAHVQQALHNRNKEQSALSLQYVSIVVICCYLCQQHVSCLVFCWTC